MGNPVLLAMEDSSRRVVLQQACNYGQQYRISKHYLFVLAGDTIDAQMFLPLICIRDTSGPPYNYLHQFPVNHCLVYSVCRA